MSPCSRCTGRPRLRRRACLRANAWRTCGTVRSATISTSVRFCATTSADSSTILSHASLAAFASWLCSAVNCISTSSTRSLLVYWSVSLKSQVQALIAICNPRDHLSLKRVYDTKPSEIEKAFLWEFKGTLPNATPTMKQWLIRGLSRYYGTMMVHHCFSKTLFSWRALALGWYPYTPIMIVGTNQKTSETPKCLGNPWNQSFPNPTKLRRKCGLKLVSVQWFS